MSANSTGGTFKVEVVDLEAARQAKKLKPHQTNDIYEAVALLAELDVVEYEQYRKGIAEDHGIRTSVLDAMVKAKRGEVDAGDDEFGWHVDPADQPVNGEALADEIRFTLLRYVALQDKESAVAIVLWIFHAW